MAAELGWSGAPSAADETAALRAASRRRNGCARIRAARAAALLPAARPNTSASVTALPESRLAPLAPPTASPAASRPGNGRLHPHVGRDPAHVVMRDRRDLDRHLGQVDAVGRQPVDHRPERGAQGGRRTVLETQECPAMGEPRPPSTSLMMA